MLSTFFVLWKLGLGQVEHEGKTFWPDTKKFRAFTAFVFEDVTNVLLWTLLTQKENFDKMWIYTWNLLITKA
jgi:isopentenyldiphosphate isomerase